MARVRVTHSIGDLAGDLQSIATQTPRRMSRVVKNAAERGNRNAKGFASEQHTMFTAVDAGYPPSFTVERRGPLSYEYGPDADIGQGSKAPGYEWGSINQAAPHGNLDRSVDIERVEFPKDVNDEVRILFAEAGF